MAYEFCRFHDGIDGQIGKFVDQHIGHFQGEWRIHFSLKLLIIKWHSCIFIQTIRYCESEKKVRDHLHLNKFEYLMMYRVFFSLRIFKKQENWC